MNRLIFLITPRSYTPLILFCGLLMSSFNAQSQCYADFYVYQVSPYGPLCSPQYATLRSEYYGNGNYVTGEFRWYASDTDPNPLQTNYITSDFGSNAADYTVYANNGTTVWISFYDYSTGCESYRTPYTFNISSSPYVYQNYASKCNVDVAKVQLSSNISGVTFQLYKLEEYYDPYWGWVQNYQYLESNNTGYFEISDLDFDNSADKFYAKVYDPYGCSQPYYYQLWFDITGPSSPTVTGNLSVGAGSSTTLSASGTAYNFNWYDGSNNLLSTGWQYNTPITLSPGNYNYQIRGASWDGSCLTSPTSVTVTVTAPVVNYTPLYNSSNFIKTIDLSKPVGTIGGGSSTTASGGVTYSVPIYTPPGTNGLQPSISIAYNSQGGNGIVGYGWNIGGLSAITRVGKDIFHNGTTSPVTYTNEDAFVLDGMRLNPISGTNGAFGTVYAGEVETFSRAVSYTPASPNNPDWFHITAKDGTQMEFGNSNDSRIRTDDGQNVMMWRLSKITDINGNYIEFKYDNGFRDSRIDEINYTGNAAAGLLPYNKLKFNYATRTDASTIFDAGASLSSKTLLNSITVKHETEIVKTYQFNYGFDNTASLLKEIVEAGSDGSQLNSTIFLYGDNPNNFYTEGSSIVAGAAVDVYTGDFDGDGVSDIVASNYQYSNSVKYNTDYSIYSRNAQNGAFQLKYTVPLNTTYQLINKKEIPNSNSFLSSDFDGDGRDDILLTQSHIYNTYYGIRRLDALQINLSKDQPTNYSPVGYSLPQIFDPIYGYSVCSLIDPPGNYIIPGDFDGDGASDFISILKTDYGAYYCFFTSPKKGIVNYAIENFGISASSIAAADNIMPIDFDGDGKMELLVTIDNQTYVLAISFYNNNLFLPYRSDVVYQTSSLTSSNKIYPGDFNGDRKTDLLVRGSITNWYILYSTGKSFGVQNFTFNETVNITDDKIIVADFNGDGKSDVLHGYNYFVGGTASTSKLSLYYLKDNATFQFFFEQYNYSNLLGFTPLSVADLNGDGRNDLINRNYYQDPFDIIYIKPNGREKLLAKVTDGHNNTTSFDYKTLTDKSNVSPFYNRTVSLDNPANNYPYNYVQPAMYAASSITTSDGIGGDNITTFNYEDAVLHRAGKGFLGFKKITSQNSASGITSVTEYEINAQFATPYTKKQTTLLTATDELLSETQITTSFDDLSTGNNDKRCLQKIDKTLNVNYLAGTASESVNTYDSYGNVAVNVSKAGTLNGNTVDALETTTTNTTYAVHNTTVPAKPDDITVSNVRTGQPVQSNTTTFTYTTSGLVASQTSFSGLPKAVTTTNSFNAFGNATSIVTSSSGLSNRTANFTYDSKGRFVTTKQIIGSTVSPSETYIYNYKWGQPLSHTSSDCLTTTFEYDAFGRLKKTNLPEGFSINNSLIWDIQGGNLYYSITSYSNGGSPDVKTWVDKLGRETKTQTAGFNNQWLTRLTTYDAKGNVATKTNDYYSSETPIVTINTYDAYNRLTSVSTPVSTITSAYTKLSGGRFQVSTSNSSGQTSTKISDATGKVITSIDDGGQLDFTYDSRGNQTQVTHGSNVLVTSSYDNYGRQTNMVDKNAGTVTYQYDAYGQLTQQTDNVGNTYSMTYDDLGRIATRQGAEGNITYEYYKDNNTGCSNSNVTKITTVGAGGVELLFPVTKEYTYNSLQRLQSEKVTIDGTDYITQYNYNTIGQLTSTTYPSGVVVNNGYDNNGNLVSVTGGNAASPTTLFTASSKNGFGQYTGYTLGNGKASQQTFSYGVPSHYYTQGVQDLNFNFDLSKGNLLSRQDLLKGITESFQYDNLNRLTNSTVNGTQQFSVNYDGNGSFSMGNILSKSDAGNYVYRNDKIHAVAYITNPAGAQVPPANIPTAQQVISYTSFLKTSSITENGYQLNYTYGPDYERVKSVVRQGPNNIESKYYVGEYEKQITGGTFRAATVRGGTTREIHYVSGGDGLCAIIVREGGVDNFYFPYSDHLGSILTVTDINGNVIAEQNFDAWGRKRNPITWQYTSVPSVPVWLYRGYTSHEHIPQFGLINMNGRMYDPVQGRMLSPDNYVSTPFGTQGYNRYAYALNNPLSYVDPDGNNPLIVAMIIGAAISAGSYTASVALSDGGFKNWNWGSFAKSVVIGGVSGAVSLGVGSAFGPVGSFSNEVMRGLAHGYSSGVLSGIFGGSFGSGFLSGSFGSFAGSATDAYINNPWLTIGASAVSGGLSSEIGGGNFWEGAATGGLVAATNHFYHSINEKIAETAEKYIGSTRWNQENYLNDDYTEGENKCNKFVYDVTTEAGASPGKYATGRFRWFKDATGIGLSEPTAGMWADPNYKIKGWRVVNNPRRGDVVAYSHQYSNASGHSGIVVGRGYSVATSGTYHMISRTAFGFSTDPHLLPVGANYVYRRYIGR